MKKLLIIFISFFSLICSAQIEYNGKYNLLLYRGSRMHVDLDTYYNYNDSAVSLFSRFSVQPSLIFKKMISNWYDTIQKYNIDDSLTHRFYFATKAQTDALIDWFDINNTADLVNTVSFSEYEGFTTNGTNSYIKTNINLNSEIKASYNSSSVYLRTNNYGTSHHLVGAYDGSQFYSIRTTTTNFTFYNNSLALAVSWAHGNNIVGNTIMARSGAAIYMSRNGADYLSQALSVNGNPPNHADGQYIGALNANGTANNFNSNQFSIYNLGGYLSEIQKQKLYESDEMLLDYYDRGMNPYYQSKVYFPINYDPNKVGGYNWVLYFHGFGGNETTALPTTWKDTLLAHNYVVVTANGYTYCGNNTHQNNFLGAYNYAKTLANVTDSVNLMSISMGGLALLNIIDKDSIPVKSLVMLSAEINIDSMYVQPSFTAAIESAYSFTGAENLQTATAGFNPTDRYIIVGVDSTYPQLPPVYWLHGNADYVAPYSEVLKLHNVLAAQIGQNSTITTVVGGVHSSGLSTPSVINTIYNWLSIFND